MLEIGGGISFGEDARDLLQLECPLAGGGVFKAPPQDHEVASADASHGCSPDLFLAIERGLDPGRKLGEIAAIVAAGRIGQRGRQHRQGEQLGGVRLRRSDRALGARLEVERPLRGGGQLGHWVVRDRQRQGSLRAAFAKDRHDVG